MVCQLRSFSYVTIVALLMAHITICSSWSGMNLVKGWVPSIRRNFGGYFQTRLGATWNVGDSVFLPRDTGGLDLVEGLIQENRGSGWYQVLLKGDGRLIKCRSSEFKPCRPASIDSATITTELEKNTVDPVIVDLDSLIQNYNAGKVDGCENSEFLDHVINHMSHKKWVVFTDLHCSPSTLNTTLIVLDHVHTLALERSAGLLFLGDFWHHRGTLRVDCLNAVLAALKDWKVPLVMIPGNHDQVSLGGHDHGLTPLQNAYRIPANQNGTKVGDPFSSKTFPGPLIFSYPTRVSDALFIPHIRDNTVMKSVLRSRHAREAKAVLAHADVKGAYMNDMIVSASELSPSMFPPGKAIYSGHFHKPHIVETKNKNVQIEYVGSPFQVSLSEAQQNKSILVLDSSDGWKCVERLPIDIGRKHFRVDTIQEFLNLSLADNCSNITRAPSVLSKNDRVVVNVDEDDLLQLRRAASSDGDDVLARHANKLRKGGVIVELRESSKNPLPSQQLDYLSFEWEDVSPRSVWTAFLHDQVSRGSLSEASADELRHPGMELLDEMELESNNLQAGRSQVFNDLILESVSVEGFGPFRSETTYPLSNRGLVLLRGTNWDGGSDSNGSGKTSLAVATLWALSGTVDPRPLQDSKVSDVINDDKKSARVTIKGSLNGMQFSVTRTKTTRGGALFFIFDGTNLTTQSVKDTQALIDEALGISPEILARTLFHGQHALNELLEASDAKFKEELSLVVPLDLWQKSAAKARENSRNARKRIAELDGMIHIRSADLDNAKAHLADESAALAAVEGNLREIESQQSAIRDSRGSEKQDWEDVCVDTISKHLEENEITLKELEDESSLLLGEKKRQLDEVNLKVSQMQERMEIVAKELNALRECQESWAIEMASAREMMETIELMWELPSLEMGVPEDLTLPSVCPTCSQSLSHSAVLHDDGLPLKEKVLLDARSARERFFQARSKVLSTMEVIKSSEETKLELEKEIGEEESELVRFNLIWDERIKGVDNKVAVLRQKQQQLSQQLAKKANRLQKDSEMNHMRLALETQEQRKEMLRSSVSKAHERVTEFEITLGELRAARIKETHSESIFSGLSEKFGQRGTQSFVLQNLVQKLEHSAQSYLTELSDGCQRLELQLDAGDRIVRRAFIVGQGGEFVERPVATLSGGQYRRCSLALNFGFAELVAQRGRFRPSLCILDEPLTHLDRTGRSMVGNSLRKLLRRPSDESGRRFGLSYSTILLILQDLAAEELEESFDCVDEVVKRGGASHVVIDGA